MTVLNLTISGASSMAQENDTDGGYNSGGTGSHSLQRFSAGSPARTHLGLHFPSVTIPAGAVIDSAILTLTCNGSDDADAIVYFNDVDSAASFADDADVFNRVKTTAGVAWAVTNAGAGSEVLPDIKTPLQEVVDRGGWDSGNNLMPIIWSNTGTYLGFSIAKTANFPTLDITYSEAASGGKSSLTLTGVG